MTPTEIENAARRKYNSLSQPSFYSSTEIFDLIYQAELEIARETKMLEGLTTTVTVASQQAYAYPTGVLELKRVEVNGFRLERIDFRDDDAITNNNSAATVVGNSLYYYDWNNTIYLRPAPQDAALVIKIYYYKEPAQVTSGVQVLETPALFHMCIADYVAAEMAEKDQNSQIAQMYFDKWYNKHMPAMKNWVRKKRTGDSFRVVKSEEDLTGLYLGNV